MNRFLSAGFALALLAGPASAQVANPLGGVTFGTGPVDGSGNQPLCIYDKPGGQCLPIFTRNGVSHAITVSPSFGYLGAGASAVPTSITAILNERFFATEDGVICDGVTDTTTKLQNAENDAEALHKILVLPSGPGACMISAGITAAAPIGIEGSPRLATTIQALPSFPSGASFIQVHPATGAYLDFLSIKDITIQPKDPTGTIRGSHAILLSFDQAPVGGGSANNITQLNIEHVYAFAGNSESLDIENNTTYNPQGVPSNSTIARNYFASSVRLVGVGDSINITSNTIRGSTSCIYISQTTASGTAGHAVTTQNNMDCAAGAYYQASGRNPVFAYNNVEISAGAGRDGAVVDFDGVTQAIVSPKVYGNAFGIFPAATANSAVRFNATYGGDFDNSNTVLCSASGSKALTISSLASDTNVGFGEVDPACAASFNAGVGTRGISIPLTLSGGFTANGFGYQAATVTKSKYGVVTLGGLLLSPANAHGLTITTLPAGYCPSSPVIASTYALIASADNTAAITIGSDCTVKYGPPNNAATGQVSLAGIQYPTTPYYVGSN